MQWRVQRRAFGLIGDALDASGEGEKALKYHAMALDVAREKGIRVPSVGECEGEGGEISGLMEARESLALAALHKRQYEEAASQAKELLLLAQQVNDANKHQLAYEVKISPFRL